MRKKLSRSHLGASGSNQAHRVSAEIEKDACDGVLAAYVDKAMDLVVCKLAANIYLHHEGRRPSFSKVQVAMC